MPIIIRRSKRKTDDANKNSKNFTDDETNQRIEKINSKSEKVKSSTENKGEPADSAEIAGEPAKTAKTATSHSISVDDSNLSKSRETEKNRISATLIDRDVVESDDGRKVVVEVYDTGQYKEFVMGDKVIRERQIKFVLKYKNITRECFGSDCADVAKEIAKMTRSHPSKKEIMAKINELREEYETSEEISVVDYVREKYSDRLAEIEKDPFEWILSRTREIVGYERLKLLTFLSVMTSQIERVMGMSRLHIMLVGKSGAGKSSTIKSVLRYLPDDMKIMSTRLTQNSLGYLHIDSFDGKVLFIEQIDRQNINYIREMMSEDKVCTLVTEKKTDADGNESFESRLRCIPGQAVVITTSVADNVDIDREQIFNRFLKVYVNPESNEVDRVISSILTRQSTEVSEVDKLVFTAYLLTRPKYADVSGVVEKAKKFVLSLQEYTREPLTRVAEILRNLLIAVAIARGKMKADDEDFEFVMQNFQLDILYNGLGLTELDVEIVKLLPDEGGLKSAEIADALRVSKQYAINVLKNLERKGVVEGEKADGKTFTWYLTALGRRIKSLISKVDDVIVVRDEKGELIGVADSKFRDDADARGDTANAVSTNDGRTVSRVDGETNRVAEAYKWLKQHGAISVAELTELYGDDIIEKLKAKNLVTFSVVDGVEYVIPK